MEKTTKWCLAIACLALVIGQNLKKPAEFRVLGAEARDSMVSVLTSQDNPNFDDTEKIKRNMAEIVRNYVYYSAVASGVDPDKAIFIVRHESNFDFYAIGDTEKICPRNGKPMRSVGLWQFEINCYNTDISEAEALSVASSTAIAFQWLKEGKENRWSVWRFCHEWFSKTCPF